MIIGNENTRGTVPIKPSDTTVTVVSTWEVIPTSITVTPSYNTNIWVSDRSKSGFTINLSQTPISEESVDWFAIW